MLHRPRITLFVAFIEEYIVVWNEAVSVIGALYEDCHSDSYYDELQVNSVTHLQFICGNYVHSITMLFFMRAF